MQRDKIYCNLILGHLVLVTLLAVCQWQAVIFPRMLIATFNLTVEDFTFKIPYIKQARDLAGVLDLFGSPWSAPGWMKSSGEMVGPGTLKGDFNGEYYKTWANYFLRYAVGY
ncbi:glycosyl hydrolase family 30 TIM-barrel domain-containing protein [Ditylenchus destructor]|nr:glycosyl hydrolase family 30 TIM-barrel domain-containing protein [Ditylenchus destructor]